MNLTSIIVQSILVFVLFILAILLYVLPSGKKTQNLPFCLFLVIISVHILIDITIEHPIFNNLKIHLMPSVLIFLYAPLLFFHANKLLDISLHEKWKHLLLFFAFGVVYLADGFSPSLFFPIYAIQYGTYIFLISRLIRKKNDTKPIVKTWIMFLVYSFGLIWSFAFLANLISSFGLENLADQIELVSYLITIIFFMGLFFFAMSQPGLFMNIRISKSNQARSLKTISNNEQVRIDKIKSLFENEKIFTDSELNRKSLASILAIDEQQLSKEINLHFKMNLSELINHYRIQESKLILKKGELNIKEIYYQVGFNSRSAFNTAFKKVVKKTPSEFKKEN